MIDYVSLIISVISLVGVITAAVITGWWQYFADERRRFSEAQKVVAKYCDPLYLAAQDLQCALYGIVTDNMLHQPEGKLEQHDMSLVYTCFAVGQYFAWSHILRRQAQFLGFSTDKVNRELASILYRIQEEFSTNKRPWHFCLWRCQQMAIGEIMTVRDATDAKGARDGKNDKDSDGGQLFCMGYAAFKQKWDKQDDFRAWFCSIESGVASLREAHSKNESEAPCARLRLLQHLLLNLMFVLNPKKSVGNTDGVRHCEPFPNRDCLCLGCQQDSQRNGAPVQASQPV